MNYVNDVLKILGVEVGEPFKVKNANGDYFGQLYCFNNELLVCEFHGGKPCESLLLTIQNMLLGNYQIVKVPFKPKYQDTYYYFDNGYSYDIKWTNSNIDFICFKIGNCFRTYEEAETKGKEIMEQLRKEYEGNHEKF